MVFPQPSDPQQLGRGPTPEFAVTPPFVFHSNPPALPTIPPVEQTGIGPINTPGSGGTAGWPA
jgi:hypothetical protein